VADISLKNRETLLARWVELRFIISRQGPWNVDLGTPPGPEGSNGTLLRIRRGYPGFEFSILDCGFLTYSQRS
jgi:hypothetical protein